MTEGRATIVGGPARHRLIEAARVPFVILRPNSFAQNLLPFAGGVALLGVHDDPTGGAHISVVHLRDVGEAAAAVLLGTGHEGRRYELTGPEAISGFDVAAAASKVIGRTVEHVHLDPRELGQRLAASGLSAWSRAATVGLYRDYAASGRDGYAARVTEDVPALTGHRAWSFVNILFDHASAFRGER